MVSGISLSKSTLFLTTITGAAPIPVNNSTSLHSLPNSGKLQPPLHRPDLHAYSLLLNHCIQKRDLHHARRLYLRLRTDPGNPLHHPSLRAKLITLFSLCRSVDEARDVFLRGFRDGAPLPESVWVAMAVGYCKNGLSDQALLLYSRMLARFVRPRNFSFSAALKASADVSDIRVGRAVHAQTVKSDEAPDQVVNNALLGLYSNCGCFDDASTVFDKMPQRNVVSWNSMISSFATRDRVFVALDAFRRMQGEGVGFSWVTLTVVLAVCGRATALLSGKEVHAQMVKSEMRPDVPAMNSLLDMYAKCGEIDYCRRVFDEMKFKDVTSWNTVLTGYALNGFMETAIKFFDQMIGSSVHPDSVSFIALLSGCSHAGLIDKGRRIFYQMESGYGVSPAIEHYACLVDLLGRAGYIKEALEVVEAMPMRPGSTVWGSLLNSCRLHGNVSLGELVAEQLFKLEPSNPGNYVILSNIYANAGMWESMKSVRETMEQRGMKKEVGCSWTQIQSRILTFVSGGSFELRNSEEFESVWNKLSRDLEEDGYNPDTDVVLHDVSEETKASWVCGHSERIATVFSLMNTSDGVPIRVTKNLRVCADCHSWMKHVSKVAKRVIVLRDTNRFHHFNGGLCSCKDYW